ncbi:MAG: energy-coupled thiamine transporter ThiT [Lachnospiraceae bacterium]|nr:energy-coupled thiamine transporter ThiT [Lachnospiraceae bacterium]
MSNFKGNFTVKRLVFTAMCIALAFITDQIKLFHMPMGGSVKLFQMFFTAFIGLLFGPATGFAGATAYGILDLLIDPYVISIPQLICDYILAYGSMGVSGFFADKKHGLITGYLAAVVCRFIFVVLSGVVFFADYAPEEMNPFVYSVLYNGAYIGAEAVLTVIVLLIPAVSAALTKVKQMANEGS